MYVYVDINKNYNVTKRRKTNLLIMRRATTQHTWFLPQETRFGQVVIFPTLSQNQKLVRTYHRESKKEFDQQKSKISCKEICMSYLGTRC